MASVTKKFDSVEAAKQKLHEIFSVGPYANNGLYTSRIRFTEGFVDKEEKTVTLKSEYWTESSLEKAFEIGIDNI